MALVYQLFSSFSASVAVAVTADISFLAPCCSYNHDVISCGVAVAVALKFYSFLRPVTIAVALFI